MRMILVVIMFGLTIQSAASESFTWYVKSEYPYTVHLKFFSKSRNVVWPNSGRVWVLDDYGTHRYSLECQYGEKICYGAWSSGDSSIYWGVGRSGKKGCDDCCYTCDGGESNIRRLID